MNRRDIIYPHYFKLILAAILIGLTCALLAYSLKFITEILEKNIFNTISGYNRLLFIVAPTIGITTIYFLRKHVFKGRKNKGITEIYKTLDHRKDHLPYFKVPSHYLNGFLTVIFGGSTGIEVSTVVASATVGNGFYSKSFSAKMFKREMICAGVAAGVAVLFCSPIGGCLFALEVISRKINKTILLCTITATLTSCLVIYLFKNEPIIHMPALPWHVKALPIFILLSVLASFLSVYFTLLVTRMKLLFGNINNNFLRVNLGALSVGAMIYFFPILYGDSYHGLNDILHSNSPIIGLFLTVAVLKPLASALTLGAGGDGGVFAPSIVAGALLGLSVAWLGNNYLSMSLIPLNFALIGAAATLSASIYAPFTSTFLICSIAPDAYILFIPLLVCSLVAQFLAKRILPYNVYTYEFYKAKIAV